MPIKIPNELPATKILTNENIFVMTETRALSQDIRPLEILVLNLMPTKIETETQLSRLLGNSPLQVNLTLMNTSTYTPKNISPGHLSEFYVTFDSIKNRNFDGLIITGAPVELMKYEDVEYWDELCEIMEWSKTHVHSTLHICWAAQAGLFYHYGIKKYILPEKLFGIFRHKIAEDKVPLFRGFDDVFAAPHSRNTTVKTEDVQKDSRLKILSYSYEAGVYAVSANGGGQIFIMGHPEYDADTLDREYKRDIALGKCIKMPKNYYRDDDPDNAPIISWRSHATLLFSNWLNYYLYQTTPYDITNIG